MIDLIVIFIPFVAFWFTNITGIPQGIKRALKKDKLRPFDCVRCLAFWLALAYQIAIGFDFWPSMLICSLSSIVGYLIEYYAEKIKLPFNR